MKSTGTSADVGTPVTAVVPTEGGLEDRSGSMTPCVNPRRREDDLGGSNASLSPTQLARLMTWLSPAFPVGSYSYSHGLEWVVEAGGVRDVATLADWVEDVLD